MRPHFAALAFVALAACGKGNAEPPAPSGPGAAPITTTPTTAGAPNAAAAPVIGQPAPDFTLKDLDGQEVALASFRGKTVVLEWFNPACPFVVRSHTEGPLQTMSADAQKDGVVWLAINSGAPGKQGAGVERNKAALTEYQLTHPILLDEQGTVGKRYNARNPPGMFVIDKDGVLRYAGAIDNAPRGEAPAEGFRNHVKEALADLAAGQAVRVAETKPYGCSVKYAD